MNALEFANILSANGMRCNCNLDNWQPESSTGHSWVCRIHKRARQLEANPGLAGRDLEKTMVTLNDFVLSPHLRITNRSTPVEIIDIDMGGVVWLVERGDDSRRLVTSVENAEKLKEIFKKGAA